MPKKTITLRGWQSWTHCKPGPTFIKRIRNHSPFPYGDIQLEAEENQSKKKPISGWCTWNSFMRNVSEEKILKVAAWLKERSAELPVEYILIDDGWCEWGDWQLTNSIKFPEGIAGTARKLHEQGFKTGLWLAPFLVSEHSSLVREKPEWFCKKRFGRWVEGRKNYRIDRFVSGRKYLLDFEQKEIFEYIVNCVKVAVTQWGITLLKLDFLYAGHFNPRYTSSQGADAKLRELLLEIKALSPELKIIACGCPFAPAVGVVDAMRISDDIILPPLKGVPVINKMLHTLRLRQLHDNFIARKETKDVWLIDPDMFVCHPSFGLSSRQLVEFQRIVQESNGVIMLGDYLPELSTEEVQRYLVPLFKK